MDRLSRLARRYGLDVLIAFAAIQAGLEVAFRVDPKRPIGTPLWFAVPAVVLVVLPLLGRRRFPFVAPVALWLLVALISFVDGQLIVLPAGVYFAGLVAAYLLGNLREAVQARVGLAVVAGAAVIVVSNDPHRTPSEFIFVPLFFSIAWLAGYAVRERAVQAEAAEDRAAKAEREREVAARIAVAEERARIARELHDVVAHAVSVMVLQVGAVRHKLPPTLEEDKDALESVERAGRTALAEMRRLLGAMRREGDDLDYTPQPGIDRLGSLLEDIRRAGLAVELHVEGEPLPLPQGVDLSAYRIIQEGLTNALKHAHASHVNVTVRYDSGELRIEVHDDGEGGVSTSDGLGHGLVGVRERVKIYGGEMTAGPASGGGFLLSARLPIAGDSR